MAMNVLSMWTIYDRPRDQPPTPRYFARRIEIQDGLVRATDETLAGDDLETLRQQFAERGLVRVHRASTDDPVIVECWL